MFLNNVMEVQVQEFLEQIKWIKRPDDRDRHIMCYEKECFYMFIFIHIFLFVYVEGVLLCGCKEKNFHFSLDFLGVYI